MEGVFALLAIGTVGSVAYLLASWRSERRARGWRDAASAAGLVNVRMRSGIGRATCLIGGAGPLTVRLESYRRGKHERGTRVVVGGLGYHAAELDVRSEGFATGIEKALGEREVELGDEAFDNAGYLHGSPALIRAVFDPQTRSMMRPLLQGRLPLGGSEAPTVRASIMDDELRVEIRHRAFEGVPPHLPAALGGLVELGKRLVRPGDPATRIAANTGREEMPAVRLGNLQLLSREYPAHAATREALQAALGDEDLEVRVHAATVTGPEGRDALLDVAARTDAPDELVARAITALGRDFPVARAIDMLRGALALDRDRVAIACACLDRLAQPDGISPESVETLARVLADADGEPAVTAARALGASVNEGAERALVAALMRDSAKVRVAAAESLGRIGTPLAVAPLREASAAHPLDGGLRRTARHAIALIQERVSGAAPGQLSLAADAGGQVSLADDDQRGRVTLATAEASGHQE